MLAAKEGTSRHPGGLQYAKACPDVLHVREKLWVIPRRRCAGPRQSDLDYLRNLPGAGGHDHHAVPQEHGLGNTVGDKEDRILLANPVISFYCTIIKFLVY